MKKRSWISKWPIDLDTVMDDDEAHKALALILDAGFTAIIKELHSQRKELQEQRQLLLRIIDPPPSTNNGK